VFLCVLCGEFVDFLRVVVKKAGPQPDDAENLKGAF
jgi:hypothetical protein